MPDRTISPIIRTLVTIFCLFCAFTSFAQRPIDVLFSPVSTIGNTSAKVFSINTLSDSIVFVQVDILPTCDFDKLSNGISPQTVMVVGNSSYPMNNVAQVMPDSMFPLQNPDGFQGWYDAKANSVYHVMLTFIVPSITSAESISILPSDSSDSNYSSASDSNSDSDKRYYSFPDIKLKTKASAKAFSTTTIKSTKLYSEPSTKSKKLLKLYKGAPICIIEDAANSSETSDRNNSNDASIFFRAVVLQSGISGYIEKDALSQERTPIEILTDCIILSKQGDANNKSDTTEIELKNSTLTPVTISINGAHVTIAPLTTQTFRLRVENPEGGEFEPKYLVVSSEGLPPMIVRCNLTSGDSYYWEFVRATSLW